MSANSNQVSHSLGAKYDFNGQRHGARECNGKTGIDKTAPDRGPGALHTWCVLGQWTLLLHEEQFEAQPVGWDQLHRTKASQGQVQAAWNATTQGPRRRKADPRPVGALGP